MRVGLGVNCMPMQHSTPPSGSNPLRLVRFPFTFTLVGGGPIVYSLDYLCSSENSLHSLRLAGGRVA